jgi:rfaE bifunctional protein kinase chain/domain
MTPQRFHEITARYRDLSIIVLGDFCLDRYLEIDPARRETSIETGLEVFNVVRVRAQPGGAGTVLNNLAALGVGRIIPLGFVGDDGEGFELIQAMQGMPGVRMERFLRTTQRCTFTYCKPLIVEPGKPPRELSRLDTKNWTPTPAGVERQLIAALQAEAEHIDAIAIVDQVDLAGSGVLTAGVLSAVAEIARRRPQLPILADCRRGLVGYPPVCWKMNRAELGKLCAPAPPGGGTVEHAACAARELAARNGRAVFVTLSEEGILAAKPDSQTCHLPALPIRGRIDIVGAGDAVTANLVTSLAAGGSTLESVELARAAGSVVIHQLGTTGTASVQQLAATLGFGS